MSKIRSANTSPEKILRKALCHSGLRGYRLKCRLCGHPDITYTKRRVAIFVDGCFWHGCPSCYRKPKSNENYWTKKLQRNIERDGRVNDTLREAGWTVKRFWEHEIIQNPDGVVKQISIALGF